MISAEKFAKCHPSTDIMHAGFSQMKPHLCGVPLTPQQPVAGLPGVAFDILDRRISVLMFKRSARRPMSIVSTHTSPLPVQHLPHSVQVNRLPLTFSMYFCSGVVQLCSCWL